MNYDIEQERRRCAAIVRMWNHCPECGAETSESRTDQAYRDKIADAILRGTPPTPEPPTPSPAPSDEV